MSRRTKKQTSSPQNLRSSSFSSFTGLQYQADLRSRGKSIDMSRSLTPDQYPSHPLKSPPPSKPSLEHLGKENIRTNKKQEFLTHEISKLSKKELEKRYRDELELKEQQIVTLLKLKEENRLNLEELAKLRHLIGQFEAQVVRVNQEKERCENGMKMMESEKLEDSRRQEQQQMELNQNKSLLQQYQEKINDLQLKLTHCDSTLLSLTETTASLRLENTTLKSQHLSLTAHLEKLSSFAASPPPTNNTDYILKASDSQNKFNELQIRYFRLQKENDQNKLAREQAENEVRELLQRMEQQKEYFQEEEAKLLTKMKTVETQKRRVEIQRAASGHDRDVKQSKRKKQREAELDTLKLQLDKCLLDLQQKTKELRCIEIERQGEIKTHQTHIQGLELAFLQERLQLQEKITFQSTQLTNLRSTHQNHESSLTTSSSLLLTLQSQLNNSLTAISSLKQSLNQKTLQIQTQKQFTQQRTLQLESQRQSLNDKNAQLQSVKQALNEKSQQLEAMRRENQQYAESMQHYRLEVESIKREFMGIVQEREEAMRRYQEELTEKENRVEELQGYLNQKEGHFQSRFEQIRGVIQARQRQKERQISNLTLRIQELSLRITALTTELTQKNTQLQNLSQLIAQNKSDSTASRQSSLQQLNAKQAQLNRFMEQNQNFHNENRNLLNLTNILRDKLQNAEEQLNRTRKLYEQQSQRTKSLTASLESTQSSLTTLTSQNQTLTDHLSTLSTTSHQTQNSLEVNLASTVAQLTNSRHEMNLIRTELVILRSTHAAVTEDTAKKQKYIFKLEEEQRRLEQVIGERKREVEGVRGWGREMEGRANLFQTKLKEYDLKGKEYQSKIRECQVQYEALQAQLNTEHHITLSLKHQNGMLKQLQQALRQNQHTKSAQTTTSIEHLLSQKKLVDRNLQQKTHEFKILSEKHLQLEARAHHLSEQATYFMKKMQESNAMLVHANQHVEDLVREIENVRKVLQRETKERARLEKVIQEQESIKPTDSMHRNSELQHLRRSLENCLKEYESLRIVQESCSAKLISMKADRDHKVVELQEARIKIRVLQTENTSIESIMTDELEKRRRIIQGLVKEKNCAKNELERSKIRF